MTEKMCNDIRGEENEIREKNEGKLGRVLKTNCEYGILNSKIGG